MFLSWSSQMAILLNSTPCCRSTVDVIIFVLLEISRNSESCNIFDDSNYISVKELERKSPFESQRGKRQTLQFISFRYKEVDVVKDLNSKTSLSTGVKFMWSVSSSKLAHSSKQRILVCIFHFTPNPRLFSCLV